MTFYLVMILILAAVCIFYCFKVIRCEEENEELKAELDKLVNHDTFYKKHLQNLKTFTPCEVLRTDNVKPSKPEAEERVGVFAEGVVKTGSWWLSESEIKRESHKKQKHKKKKPKA